MTLLSVLFKTFILFFTNIGDVLVSTGAVGSPVAGQAPTCKTDTLKLTAKKEEDFEAELALAA